MAFWIPQASPDDRCRFQLNVTAACCVGPADTQFFMGGVGFATAIAALEQATDKPLLWASVQFLSQTVAGACVDIDVDITLPGRNITQAMATVSDGGRVLHRTMAALGARSEPTRQQFLSMPDVPSPTSCPVKADNAYAQEGNLLTRFERRTARQSDADGLEYLWVRPVDPLPLTSGLLAIMADFFLGAHDRTRGGTSLDNTFRLYRTAPAGWVLNVVQLDGFDRGAVHGSLHQFTEDGGLLAIASQTGLLPRR